MTELASGSAAMSDFYNNIANYRGSPVRVLQAFYDLVDEVTTNQVNLVDPTNPLVMLLEMSATIGAAAINESMLNDRRSYVGLAQTLQDVLRHLTDVEYPGLYATPGSAEFTFMIDYQGLLNAMVLDPTTNALTATLSRNSYVVVDNYTFTMEYPIVFRKYPNGTFQVTYDNTYSSPVTTLTNNNIKPLLQSLNGMSWVTFTAPIKQMEVASTVQAINPQIIFDKAFPFDNEFVLAQVFQKNNGTNGQWSQMVATYSDTVFDNNTPTAVLEVLDGELNVTIPFIYNLQGNVSGQLRVDIYTTQGSISVNLGSYTPDQFALTYRNIDDIRDDSVFTAALNNVSLQVFSTEISTPGTDAATFEYLREKVVSYALGGFNIPITNAQLDTTFTNNGFTLVRNADSVTERSLLGIQAIPVITATSSSSSNQKLLCRANVGIVRYASTLAALETSHNVAVSSDTNRMTLLSGTVFTLINGIAALVEPEVISSLKSQNLASLVATVNTTAYGYVPYYYVIDYSGITVDIRPYDLDHPQVANLNFILQNQTLALVVNTGTYNLATITGGYRLTIETSSGAAFKQLNDNQVFVQLGFASEDGSLYGTINGTQQAVDPTTGERIYTFDILTSYDVDETNALEITNAWNNEGVQLTSFFISLDLTVDVLYSTTSKPTGFIADATDNLINKTQLPPGAVGNDHDTLEMIFGQSLSQLWARSRNYATGLTYQTAANDIVQLYAEDVFEIQDATTGATLYFDGPGYVGPSGSTTFYSHGAPLPSTGAIGDFCIDEDANVVYGPKTVNGWGSVNTSLAVTNSGTPNFHKLHAAGEMVYTDGVLQYQYQAGDTLLDANGNPIPVTQPQATFEMDLLVLDGNFGFVTDPNYTTYLDQVINLLTTWATVDILAVQAIVLQRTMVYFYPQSSLGVTQLVTGTGQSAITSYVDSEQSLTVEVLLDVSVVNDTNVQNTIISLLSPYLDNAISQPKFSVQALENDMKTLAGSNCSGVNLSGVGGTKNLRYVNVSDTHNRLAVNRILVLNTDQTISMTPDINFIFTPF